ncbi:AAA domain-containing protein [Pseudomonas sp. MN1F]|uniref:AAA domain-containing protein n=1 Tax=Pseudomonas sp. MN1F TaxID=1366632 RepID=UPI00128E9908|nr:AAA domain-containing protein [Pseudomonas sp. MN1F]MQG91107.1 AAA family ATPase [Pseudomonas sp. MN1F]
MPDADHLSLKVTDIGEYIRHHSCARRLKLGKDEQQLRRDLPFYNRLFNPLDPVLRTAGADREDEVDDGLVGEGFVDLTRFRARRDAGEDTKTTWVAFTEMLRALEPGALVFGRELDVQGLVGTFAVLGRIDFVVVEWDNLAPRIRLVECKASRKDRTYQRIQAAVYRLLVRKLVEEHGLEIAGADVGANSIEAVVARIDEGTEEVQPVRGLPALDLEVETSDVIRLLEEGGQMDAVLSKDLQDLPYSIESKCDHCKFNVVCLPEAGRSRAMQLVAIDSSAARVLQNNGIQNIDQLAELDLDSPAARGCRTAPGFSGNLSMLKALARTRRTTLPNGEHDPEDYPVARLPWRVQSQLPPFEAQGRPVVRIYLGVHYDYVENRIGSLAAHITTSRWQLHTPFRNENGRWAPEATIVERLKTDAVGEDGRPIYQQRDLAEFRDVIRTRAAPWSSNHDVATGQEAELLQGFFDEMINAITDIAPERQASIHFYVWSRAEMSQLIEACLRSDTRLLRSLQELMGCREPLDQLIFSCVGEEADKQLALGWTGRGLSVLTSLRWYGERFHWTRTINRAPVKLDWVFRQDLFDFKTQLELRPDNEWARDRDREKVAYHFEIRSRFFDSLSAPYWRAYWRTLPRPETAEDAQQRGQLERYYEAAQPNYLQGLLQARLHAMRWVEWFLPRNDEISKPRLDVVALRQFNLGIATPAEAALDFLRLDHHVKVAEWLSTHMVPASNRVAKGITLPLRNLQEAAGGRELTAEIDIATYGTDLATLRNIYSGSEFARLSPHSGAPEVGQTMRQLLFGGSTCVVEDIDWVNGIVRLSPLYSQAGRYIAASQSANRVDFAFATLDESISDFVAPKADARLATIPVHHTYQWLDTANPRVPAQESLAELSTQRLLAALDTFRTLQGHQLMRDQQRAIVEGISARIQLLQGPPGTGKTQTTAASVLSRCWTSLGAGGIVMIGAQTHTAVDELMLRISATIDPLQRAFEAAGLATLPVHLFRVDPRADLVGITELRSNAAVRTLRDALANGIAIIGGTTTALLKLATSLDASAAFGRRAAGFQSNLLIVDEASMMVLAHFLALTTLLAEDGQIMLAGDHRQLAPIVAHNWEEEDRYPVTVYQPYVSAYEAVRGIKVRRRVADDQVVLSSLTFTFRLPEVVRHLINPVYQRDDIRLEGRGREAELAHEVVTGSPWSAIWTDSERLHLVVHDDQSSVKANPLEVEIIEGILQSKNEHPPRSVVVMTPHRAQRSLLTQQLGMRDEILRIDTVEKMQGGECPVVIVSATASDTAAITKNAAFILDLNRANVAFSRTQERLIVVCAKSLLDNVPADLENYESAMLWKAIRELCKRVVGEVEIGGAHAVIYSPEARDEINV